MVCLVACLLDRRRRAAVQIHAAGKPLMMLLLEQQLFVSDV